MVVGLALEELNADPEDNDRLLFARPARRPDSRIRICQRAPVASPGDCSGKGLLQPVARLPEISTFYLSAIVATS